MKTALITGGYPRQCGRSGSLDYASGTEPLVECVRRLGYEVDWRPVFPYEDVSGYDVVFCGFAPMLAINCTWGFGMSHVMMERPDAVLFLTDMVANSQDHMRLTRNPGAQRRLWQVDTVKKHGRDTVIEVGDVDKYNDFWQRYSEYAPHPILAPMFAHSDPTTMNLNADIVVPYDLSMTWMKLFPRVSPDDALRERDKAWVMAALAETHHLWADVVAMRLKWNVERYGSSKRGYPRLKTEQEIYDRVLACRGVLSPPQPGKPGLCRARYVMAVQTLTACGSDKADGAAVSEAHATTPRHIEANDWFEIAQAQRAALDDIIMSDDVMDTVVRDMIAVAQGPLSRKPKGVPMKPIPTTELGVRWATALGRGSTKRWRTLLIDGDILIYQTVCEAMEQRQNADYEVYQHIDLKKVYESISMRMAEMHVQLRAPDAIVCLGSKSNWRKRVMPEYKANRGAGKPLGYFQAVAWMEENFECMTIPHLEADDLMGILQTTPYDSDQETVIVSEDKDMKTVPGLLYNPRRPAEGVVTITPAQATRFHLMQTLMGDGADNYKGVPGVGPVKAAKILDQFPAEDRWPAVLAAYDKAKLTEAEALITAQIAHILQYDDYDQETGKLRLWSPKPIVQGAS